MVRQIPEASYPSLYLNFGNERRGRPTPPLVLSSKRAIATVDPLLGGAMTNFRVDEQDILVPEPNSPSDGKIRFGMTHMRPFVGQWREQQRSMGEIYVEQPQHGVGRFAIVGVPQQYENDRTRVVLSHTPTPNEFELFGAIKTTQVVNLWQGCAEMCFFFENVDPDKFPNYMTLGCHPYFTGPVNILFGPSLETPEVGRRAVTHENPQTNQIIFKNAGGKTVVLSAEPRPTRWLYWRASEEHMCFEPVWSGITVEFGKATDMFKFRIEVD